MEMDDATRCPHFTIIRVSVAHNIDRLATAIDVVTHHGSWPPSVIRVASLFTLRHVGIFAAILSYPFSRLRGPGVPPQTGNHHGILAQECS